MAGAAGAWFYFREPVSPGVAGQAGPFGETEEAHQRHAVLAAAPSWVDESSLGRPVGEDFAPLAGPGAASLFPSSSPRRSNKNSMSHAYERIDTDMKLKANASAWGIGSVAIGGSNAKHYAVYRAVQTDYVEEVDDTTSNRQAPAGAAYYVWRIYFGHMYEVVASGSDTTFNAAVQAQFEVGKFGTEGELRKAGIDVTARGVGLKPKTGEAIFAKTPQQIEANYTAEGGAVPIFVEYARALGTSAPSEEAIPQAQPVKVTVRYKEVLVYEDGTWFKSKWTTYARCRVNGSEFPLGADDKGELVLDQKVGKTGDNCGWGPSHRSQVCDRVTVNWQHDFDITGGGTIACGMQGVVDNGKKQIGWTAFAPVTVRRGAPAVGGKFGDNTGDTEYQVLYTIEFGQ